MQDTCKTIWIPFGDGRAARVRIDMHAPVLPVPLEVESPAVPSELDMEHVLHGLANDEGQADAPFDIGLPPVPLFMRQLAESRHSGRLADPIS